MSVVTFEDLLPGQTLESFHPSKQPQSETMPLMNDLNNTISKLENNTNSRPSDNVPKQLPLSKPTGNTPRFGAGKKIGPLVPLKPLPGKLVPKINQKCLSENSPMIGRENNEKSFDNHNTGGTPYISLSPSNQTKLETGSVGNSPRKKPSSLKHPLISKKSPLFKKFGLDAVFMNQNNSNMGFSDGYEAYLQERKQAKSATPPLESETRNIKQRVHMNQMREKHLDVKRANGSENNAPNSHFNTSLSNINEKKASESFTFYSAKKTNHTPRGSVLSKVALDIYNSEPHLTSESAIAWSQSMINAAKVRAVNTKENFPIVKVHDSKPPQSILSQNHNMVSSNLRPLTLPQKSGLLKNNNPGEDNSQNENNLCPVKETAQVEFRRKIVQQAKKVVFSSKVITGSIKDGLVNESINSLELSAIQDVNDKDILNISRDDALLQYIDKSQAEQEGLDKLPKHPLKLLKQLTSDFSITNGENIGSNRSNKKSNSLSDLGSPKQLVQVEEIVSTQLSHSIMKKETESKPFIYSNQLRGRKMQARSFIIEDSTTKATDRNHDRNSSMHEIQKYYHEKNFLSQEDRVPERLRQRRVESALPRPSDSYHNKMPDDYRGWKDRSYRDNFQLKQQKAPNSEKSNLKHFHFQGSPSLNASILDGQEEKRINQKRIYLNPKPSTSGGMKRSFLKNEKIVIPNRIGNLKNTTFAFNSVGHSSNLNESGLGFEESVQNDKFELTLSNSNNNKGEASLIFRQNGLDNSSLNQNDSTIQKLREEIKKLQTKDQESQMKIARLQLQLDSQNKEWEKKFIIYDQKWKQRFNQQREFYEQVYGNKGKKTQE